MHYRWTSCGWSPTCFSWVFWSPQLRACRAGMDVSSGVAGADDSSGAPALQACSAGADDSRKASLLRACCASDAPPVCGELAVVAISGNSSVAGSSKLRSTSTRGQVWRPAVEKLASLQQAWAGRDCSLSPADFTGSGNRSGVCGHGCPPSSSFPRFRVTWTG